MQKLQPIHEGSATCCNSFTLGDQHGTFVTQLYIPKTHDKHSSLLGLTGVHGWVAQKGDDSAEGLSCSASPEGAQTPVANCDVMHTEETG